MIYGVIMAGGKGERFWPLSRENHPKQLLKITSDKTMLQETIDRVVDFIPLPRIRIVTGENLYQPILDKIDYLKDENLITEPFGRNTCLTIGLAAAHLQKEDPKSIMVVLSCDHAIKPTDALIEILNTGCQVAGDKDCLITIGITPSRAETGYGYIEKSDLYDRFGAVSIFKIKEFTEKPDRVTAQQYYYDRRHLWNSGMFIWSTRTILEAIRKHKPSMGKLLDDYAEKIGTDEELEARKNLFNNAEKVSIDVAVLERADNVLVIKGELMWDDVGTWRAMERVRKLDKNNNVTEGEVVALESYESTIINYPDDGIIATLGVSDLVIVRCDDVVMVVHRSRARDIPKLLARLREDKKYEKYT